VEESRDLKVVPDGSDRDVLALTKVQRESSNETDIIIVMKKTTASPDSSVSRLTARDKVSMAIMPIDSVVST
jgi:hypothetical protein